MAGRDLDWGALFGRYRAMAMGFARGLVGDASTADDLFQEACRATLERGRDLAHRGGFEDESHARNYLFRALRNLAVDARRQRGRAPGELVGEPAARQSGPVEQVLRSELAGRRQASLRSSFAALPDRERNALTRRYLDGCSYREMAAASGTSISTLQARVAAGLRRLRAALQSGGIGPDDED